MIHTAFESTAFDEATHRWAKHAHTVSACATGELACLLADAIVRQRCVGCLHHYFAWKERATNGTVLPATSAAALPYFVASAVGLPNQSITVTDDHLQAFVAEHLWYALVSHFPGSEETVFLEPPSFFVTSQGGDGLAIHRMDEGQLRFRLWEIKKSTGENGVSSTVSVAYNQLEVRAAIYLAQYSMTGEGKATDKELADFYGRLVDLWLEASASAAIGVSVVTSTSDIPEQCYSTLGTRFDRFLTPNRSRGMLTAVDDLPEFARLVQRAIWIGL